ncbi:MAG TPA: hypothetical protein VK166_17760 [Chitinophagaceae bacterium]|nr:hypothetical protein [Chitinophagaceae bacterium]
MFKNGIIFVLALFVSAASCNKVTEPDTEFNGNKILKISYGNNDETTFNYSGELLNTLRFKEDNQVSEAVIQYNSEKKISEIRLDDGLVYRMRYALGEITVIDIFNAQNSRIAFIEISYTGGGLLRQMTTFTKRADPAAFPPSIRTTYDYYNDGKGNPRLVTHETWIDALNDFIPSASFEYSEYDDKVNPITHLRIIGYLFFRMNSANNPRKVVEKDEDGNIVSSRQFTFNYRPNNLPAKANETVTENGTTTTGTIEFFY